MFDVESSYPFEYRGASASLEGFPYIRHTYAFLNREGHTYIVWVDEFEDSYLYGIKYFRSDFLECKDQFNVILNTFDYKSVISTVLEIIVITHKEQPLASFIFQGANSIDESEENTQRYKVWSLIARSVLSKEKFDFFSYDKKSVLLVRNRDCTKAVIAEIDDMLKNYGVIF